MCFAQLIFFGWGAKLCLDAFLKHDRFTLVAPGYQVHNCRKEVRTQRSSHPSFVAFQSACQLHTALWRYINYSEVISTGIFHQSYLKLDFYATLDDSGLLPVAALELLGRPELQGANLGGCSLSPGRPQAKSEPCDGSSSRSAGPQGAQHHV